MRLPLAGMRWVGVQTYETGRRCAGKRYDQLAARRTPLDLRTTEHRVSDLGDDPLGRHKGRTSQGNYDYMVNFDPELFPDRDRLRTALLAEGMPLPTAYPPMHQLEMFSREGGLAPHIRDTSAYPAYASLHMPVAEHLSKTAIWFKTEVLTGSRQDAQSVVDAIEKVHGRAAEIAELEPTEW